MPVSTPFNVLGGGDSQTTPSGGTVVGTSGITSGQVAYGDTTANTIKGEAAFAYNDTTNTLTVAALNLTTALTAEDGGTGQSSYTVGDLLYASGATTLSKLAGGTAGFVLTAQGAGVAPIYVAPSGAGLGDFSGPASATDNAIVRFDGVTGKSGQNSGVTISDTNNITVPGTGTHTFGTTNTVTMAAGVITATHASGDTITLSKGTGPSIKFLKTDATAQTWNVTGQGADFRIADTTAGTAPLVIAASTGATTLAGNLTVSGTGAQAIGGVASRLVLQGGTAETPASASATGTAGSVVWDASYIYVCIAANTWKRVAIATW